MVPMGLISTPFLTYREISTSDNDLYEDAYGLKSEFTDVFSFLGNFESEPGFEAVERLIARASERKEQSATG